MGDTFGDKFKKAFKLGGSSKDGGEDSPLASGAHGAGSGVKGGSPQGTSPMAPHSGDKTPIAMTGTQKDTLPSTTGGSAGEGHAGGIMDKIKGAMGGAPWQDHHDKTLEALKHAKKAHLHAMQAQASLKSAQEAQNKAETARRHAQEMEAELERHRTGQGALGTHKKNLDDAQSALPGIQKIHDHHHGLARDAAAAAAAKEAEANRLKPNHEEHTKGLGPLETEHARLAKMRGEHETRREALLRELHELEAKLNPLKEEEAMALKKLNDHKAHGESGKQAHAAALAEAEQLRRKADQHNKDLEPHAARLRDHHALLARHESAYNKAQEDGRMAEGRLPQLKEQAAQADREAADAAKQAQHHSDTFEKLKREAEAEDAKKAELWAQARKAGHLEEDGADKQDLHKFADRVHTVLKNPIDTSLLGKNPLAKSEASGIPATPERSDMTATKPIAAKTGTREE
ncbi:g6982 [Coccomyxa viridis]|uniref:G6982 protein n=1 Tax=Coccomyxa viridis TaxID=1274662 RepID=A0ABP1FWP4_9CHLO